MCARHARHTAYVGITVRKRITGLVEKPLFQWSTMHFGGLHEDQIVGKAYDRKLMKRFLRYLTPYRWKVVAVLCILPLVTGARLGQPWLLKAGH